MDDCTAGRVETSDKSDQKAVIPVVGLLTLINTLLLAVIICQRGMKLSALRRIEKSTATQEERLQAIAAKIDEVLSDLATLKTNNPQIEDEISAIEAKLSIAQPSAGEGDAEPTA